jgi:hypothetical protein
MGPSDSLPPACPSYLFPAQAGAHFPCSGTAGSPKFLVVLSVRAVSFHPGESTRACQHRSSQAVLVSSFKGD